MKYLLKKICCLLLAGTLLFSISSGCAKKTPDTIRYFNGACGILTALNGGDLQLFGGFSYDAEQAPVFQALLQESWNVTDQETAEKALHWLLAEGHRSLFLEEYAYYDLEHFSPKELAAATAELTPEDQLYFRSLTEPYERFGAHAIDAWDYCRAIQLAANAYLAGFYSYEEALDAALPAAKSLQETYDSWDSMMESYLYGYQYWSQEDLSDPASDAAGRAAIYEELKTVKNSPYGLDWNTELVKCW